jgi:hypothetical protein
MNKHQLEFAVQWLEQKQKTLQTVSNDSPVETDFIRGFNKGIQFANKSYEESIKELRQLLDGFIVEDINFDYQEESAC